MERVDPQISELVAAANRSAWRDVMRRDRGEDLERSIKALAKGFAQATAQPVRDRHARQDARIAVYNDLVPLLTRFAEGRVRLLRTSIYAVTVLATAACGAMAVLALL